MIIPMKRWTCLALLALVPGCNLSERKQSLGGAVPSFWEAAPVSAAPVHLEESWLSTPTRSANGTVFGFVQTESGSALLAVREDTGQVVWRVPARQVLPSFTRTDGWRTGEDFPALPLTAEGGGTYVVTWQREWARVEMASGRVLGAGTYPEGVPAASPVSGVCVDGSRFWIGVEDGGRGGGVWLEPNGVMQAARTERPATCARTSGGSLASLSPMQNAKDSPSEYDPEICGKYSKQERERVGNAYCTDKRSDGGPERDVMLMIQEPLFRSGKRWLHVEMPHGPAVQANTPDFAPWPFSLELGENAAFLDYADIHTSSVERLAKPESFEPNVTEVMDQEVELIAAIGRNGDLQWARTLRNVQVPRTGWATRDRALPWRSTLFASHRSSPVHNVYVLKPGMLLALDQATGATRFSVGRALP